MILAKRIPDDFYKLFRTKNMKFYMMFLVAIYEENNEVYTALGLTLEECRAVVAEVIAGQGILMQADEQEEMEPEETDNFSDVQLSFNSPATIVHKLISWGWLRRDFDDRLNQYVVTFPEYSQLYVELFQRMNREDDSRERESILSVYSALYTFHADKEKNNEILKAAVRTSRSLGQMLSNMQDGMKDYFDRLSREKNFIGIQQVLVDEINNNDSKKYAILTTTDSFYRYKESVKELISQILYDNDNLKVQLEIQMRQIMQEQAQNQDPQNSQNTKETIAVRRAEKKLFLCEETAGLVNQVEREFNLIERKYNKLIEQKAVFARRALARVQYVMQEGSNSEDSIVNLIRLLGRTDRRSAILQELSEKMGCTMPYTILTDKSFRESRDREDKSFAPAAAAVEEISAGDIEDFVPKPLYSKRQLEQFRLKNTKNGIFTATKETVASVSDLEKLMFLWQNATASRLGEDKISLGEELTTEDGYSFSQLTIKE